MVRVRAASGRGRVSPRGIPPEALEWLRTAEADVRASGACGRSARVRYDIARCLLASGADAGSTLGDAIEGFERLGYRTLLRAARRLAGRSDEGPAAESGATRVIMVTDLIDSTPLAQRVGGQRFVELLREHNRIVRTRLQQFDGVEFKHTGDGIAAWFVTAGAAVECGLLILEDLERSNATRDEPLFIRIGIAAGEVVNEGADVLGVAVITAFRICDHARDGRIVVSKEVPPLVGNAGFRFVSFGDVSLKGFSDKTPCTRSSRTAADKHDRFSMLRPAHTAGRSVCLEECPTSSRRARTSRSPSRCSAIAISDSSF